MTGSSYHPDPMDERLELYGELAQPSGRRILLFVIDGLGGLPRGPGAPTELEAAATPTLDRLAAEGETGLSTPVAPGVTPGSGPAHLGLFGYDPVTVRVGRGVLGALGIGFDLQPGDLAARINFCTLDEEGRVVDRRAGRIDGDEALPLVERLDGIELSGDVRCTVRHEKQYRACLILRGDDLDGRLADTDPQDTGVSPRDPEPLHPDAERTAGLVARFIEAAGQRLAGEPRANGVLLRGFDTYRSLPSFEELYGLRAAAVAAYPMYRGVARLVGMEAHAVADEPDEVVGLVAGLGDADFVYVHYKSTDSRGEDGDFEAKAEEIERADELLARLLELGFDVVVVTGDHSTPATMRSHSWHPVPLLLWGPHCRGGDDGGFGERACQGGPLGQLRSVDVVPLALAQADRLRKFGA